MTRVVFLKILSPIIIAEVYRERNIAAHLGLRLKSICDNPISPFPYFELQGRVAATGRQRGYGRVVQAIGEQGAAGVREGQVVGVLRNWRGNGRQRTKEVV